MAGGELALNVSSKEEAERLRIEAAQRDPSRFPELYEDNFERVYAFIARDVRDPDQPAEVGLEDVEQRAQLFRLVGQLPPDQHRVIVMRFAEQKRIREIAHELGRTEGAVKQLQLRGLQNLRARLSDRNG